MIKIKSKVLPISCICSIYINTDLKELIIAIDSLLMQEYTPNEIVIIVDGIIKKNIKPFLDFIADNKSLFKIYYLKRNIGLGLALNYGIKKCRNKLIARFDSDDINLEDRLKIQYDMLIKNPEVSVIGSDILEFNNFNEDLIIKRMRYNFKNRFRSYMIRNPLNHPTVLFRKADIIKVGLYKDMKFFEDYELWLRCIKSGLKINNINKPLVAMKRESYFSRRKGLKYAFYELKFLKENIKQKTISRFFIPVYIIRILVRIIPFKISYLIELIDLKRVDYEKSFDLKNYINKINTYNNYISKRFK